MLEVLDAPTEDNEAKKELAQERKRNAQLTTQLKDCFLRSEYDAVEDKRAAAVKSMKELQLKYDQLKTERDDLETKLKDANNRIDKLHLSKTIRRL